MADFLLLSTADWDHPLWTNKQHVAISLAAAGHRVLYVDSLGLRPPRSGRADRQRILRRLWRGLRPPRRVRPRLWVLSPLVLPGGTSGPRLLLNRLLLALWLGAAQLMLGFRRPILWTYNPLTLEFLPGYRGRIVYHCVDRIQAQPQMPAARIEAAEHGLCRRADVVFTTAPELQRMLAPLNPHTFFYGNVADYDHFSTAHRAGGLLPPPKLLALPSPRIGFMGAIDGYKLDLPMLTALAQATPSWSYALIGPVAHGDPGTDVSALMALPNVHFFGAQAYADLPALLAGLDVALLPLQINDYTRHMFPMKFFEYLAAGRAVVATAIPSLRPFASVALLCPPDANAFQQAINRALAGEAPPLQDRLEVARMHTYQTRTDRMLENLQRLALLPG